MDFLVSEGIFQKRIIPQGAAISHPVSSREFSRILARMGSREDGVPAEILNFSPDSFQENLRLLINTVFASEFKMPKETLSAKVILLYKKGNPSLLVSYRPIALLTSTYQLMNLMLAGRLQDLAERNGLFAMGSSYVLTSTMPTLSTLRAMLAFGPFWISSGSLILTCLRTSTIWPPCGSAWGRMMKPNESKSAQDTLCR
jgi:hypothetical protein